jgi:hypothetical protein
MRIGRFPGTEELEHRSMERVRNIPLRWGTTSNIASSESCSRTYPDRRLMSVRGLGASTGKLVWEQPARAVRDGVPRQRRGGA